MIVAPALLVTIDTEADNQWDSAQGLALENLGELPRFQAFCQDFGVKPTYLCTHEVAVSPRFDEVLGPAAERGDAEVGAHLHPWSNPPYESQQVDADPAPPRGRPYPSELPLDVFEAKMAALTEALETASGRKPTSYRAGRWGFAGAHAPVLRKLGYRVDCSVTPETTWADHPGERAPGPDFRGAPPTPYVLDERDPRLPGRSGLFEAPVTILRTSPLERYPLVRWLQGFDKPAKVLRKTRLARGPRWLRPWPHTTGRDLVAVYREACRQGLPMVEVMFHSSELLPGGSPFWADRAAVDKLYGQLKRLFKHARQQGSRGMTVTGFADHWEALLADEADRVREAAAALAVVAASREAA